MSATDRVDLIRQRLRKVIVDEYSEDEIYRFAYSAGYKNDYATPGEYLNQVAELVMTGIMNGANDTLEGIYRSLMGLDRLLPVRRYPRRLKMW